MTETERLPGSRLSISALEQQMPRYKAFERTGEITSPEIKNPNHELLQEKAKESFRGTQIHNLIYILQLHNRCQKLDRFPTYQDLRDTYPTSSLEESDAMAQLYEQNPDNPVEVWRQWVENSELPKKKNVSTVLDPGITMDIWSNVVEDYEIDAVRENIDDRDLNQIEMNELLSILNLRFERNLQIPSLADTVIISKDYPNTPITIVDYKSGKDLSEIDFLDKLQALLISTSIFYNIVDKVPKITWNLSQWDATHSAKSIEFPHFKKRSTLSPFRLNCSVEDSQLIYDLGIIAKNVRFILKNPLSNESKEVKFLPIAKSAIEYLDRLNTFYAENKEKLKGNKNHNFLTPQFVPEKVLYPEKYKAKKNSLGTQVSLF